MKAKKYILYLLCTILCSCLFFGCDRNKEQQKEKVEENHNIESNDIEDSEITKTPIITEEVINEVLENYKEKSIPSVYTENNKKERYCNVILNENKEIEYYTVVKEEDGHYVWKYTLIENGEGSNDIWEREAVLWLDGIKKKISYSRVTVFLGEDLNEYALYIDDKEQPHIVKRNGDSCTEILGLDLRQTDFREIAVLKNGNIVSADMGKECFIYRQEDGSLITSFPCGWYESLCVKGNQIYIIDQTNSYLQHYDAEQQEFKTAIEASFNTSIRIAAREDDVYTCCFKGIYHTKESGKEFQKVLDAKTYHFAKKTAILLKFFVRDNTFYIVYAEDGGIIKKYVPAGQEDKADKFLTIYSLKNNDVILDMISEFQTKYPDTEIVYETGEGSEGSITIADRIRVLNARILAGDGPDVLVLDGLPMESYIKKGILSDLTLALEQRKKELLPTILSSYTIENKIYMLPLRFSVPIFVFSGENSEVYSTLEALVEYSEENDGVMQGGYSYSDLLEMLYYNYRPEIILEDNTINKENLKDFLEQTKRFCKSEGISETTDHLLTYLEGYSNGNDLIYGKANFLMINMNGGVELGYLPSLIEYKNGEMVGNNGIFFPSTILGINSLSKKKELAYLFFEFAISYEIQKRLIDLSGYQIDTKVLDKFAQIDLSHITNSGGDNGELIFRWFTKEESQQMIQIAKEVHTLFTVDASVWQIIQEEAIKYLKDQKTLEECVDTIANRIQLYLYEQ